MEQERMKVLLQNALGLLEENCGEKIMESDLADELGIAQEEYDELLPEEDEELDEDEYNDRACDFDEYVTKRLEEEEGLVNVFIEPSVQCGQGGLFIHHDNCEGDTPVVDFETADEYIYNNDKEGYYNYILSAIK